MKYAGPQSWQTWLSWIFKPGSLAPMLQKLESPMKVSQELICDSLILWHLGKDKCFACLKTPFSLPVPVIRLCGQ